MKKLLSLLVVGGLLSFGIGCSEETKSANKTKTSKEVVRPSGQVEKTTVEKEVKKEDGKVIESKEVKKTETK